MSPRRWLLLMLAGLALALLAWLSLSGAMLWSTLSGDERQSLAELLQPRAGLLGVALLIALGAAALLLMKFALPQRSAAARLLEQLRLRLDADAAHPIEAREGGLAPLADAINQLLEQRTTLRADLSEQIAAASRGVELERRRLAALMSELTQSVVVCNLDGRVLLYNQRARMQFRALSSAPGVAGGAELLGLGRSIYAAFDRELIDHALESLRQRLQRGAEHPSTQFVTSTRSGQLLRVQMAPVREVALDFAHGPADPRALAGFVLMLDNVTAEFEQDRLRDQALHALTEGLRGALAQLQSAADQLDHDDDDDGSRQPALHALLRRELAGLREQVEQHAAQARSGIGTRWPLEDMLGADLVHAARQRLESALGLRVGLDEVDESLWLRVDSYALLLSLHYLAGRLHEEFDIGLVQLRLQGGDEAQVHLDLLWTGQALSTETVMSWETDAMQIGADTSPLSVREVVGRHGGRFWFERERARQRALFRFALPRAAAHERVDAALLSQAPGRPEFYDFDLFQASELHHELDQRRLVDLAYTVFDTETTGLEPSQGDEIIQIGAARISGGKLRHQECFEQLIDPRRSIPAAGIPIHGIRPEMVVGQPPIEEVLPAFHRYAQDTVLVAHNAAFDMRFLQLKEAATGLVFDQPVLDTLLLSAIVHPNQSSHRLEALAERFNLTIVGRHTALGDAMVTAEVFLRLIPLLQAMGIETLGQARTAAQNSYYARLKY